MYYANHDKINLQHFYVLKYFFYIFFSPYLKMPKKSSTKCYQNNNKERIQKKLEEYIKVFIKNKREKKE